MKPVFLFVQVYIFEDIERCFLAQENNLKILEAKIKKLCGFTQHKNQITPPQTVINSKIWQQTYNRLVRRSITRSIVLIQLKKCYYDPRINFIINTNPLAQTPTIDNRQMTRIFHKISKAIRLSCAGTSRRPHLRNINHISTHSPQCIKSNCGLERNNISLFISNSFSIELSVERCEWVSKNDERITFVFISMLPTMYERFRDQTQKIYFLS